MPDAHHPPADATTRFSNRVADYVKFRPGYPPGAIDLLVERCGLGRDSTVADIGAGTGIFTRLLLQTGAVVHAIEPNDEMRSALLAASAGELRLRALGSPAEETGLVGQSVELITAAQAFHWFDRAAARREFSRILRPGGWVALVWNTRRDDTPFLAAYDAILERWAIDYGKVEHRNVGMEVIRPFFDPGKVERHVFDYAQHLDRESLCGRFLSSSYAPAPGHPNHEPALSALRELFARHVTEGRASFDYTTEVYLGHFL